MTPGAILTFSMYVNLCRHGYIMQYIAITDIHGTHKLELYYVRIRVMVVLILLHLYRNFLFADCAITSHIKIKNFSTGLINKST